MPYINKNQKPHILARGHKISIQCMRMMKDNPEKMIHKGEIKDTRVNKA